MIYLFPLPLDYNSIFFLKKNHTKNTINVLLYTAFKKNVLLYTITSIQRVSEFHSAPRYTHVAAGRADPWAQLDS